MITLILFLASMLSINADNMQKTNETTLIYVGDPMCSWCYGFGPELSKVKAAMPDDVQFQMVMGGLRPNGTQTMSELNDFLRSHWEEIHERTGQPFSYDILDQKDFVYDTEPACRAVVTAGQIAPDKAYAFFEATQSAFYAKNKSTADINTYLGIAKELEIDESAFKSMFNSADATAATNQDFELAGQMGVRSFPTLILKKGEEYFLLAQGYQTSDVLIRGMNQLMSDD